jgi:hypothetical protein
MAVAAPAGIDLDQMADGLSLHKMRSGAARLPTYLRAAVGGIATFQTKFHQICPAEFITA